MEGEFDAAAFGERIKAMRASRRMTLEDVGAAAGFTKSHVWELETGRSRNPTVRAAWALARALGTTPAHLLGFGDQDSLLDPAAMEIACMVDRTLRARAAKEQIELANRPTDVGPEVVCTLTDDQTAILRSTLTSIANSRFSIHCIAAKNALALLPEPVDADEAEAARIIRDLILCNDDHITQARVKHLLIRAVKAGRALASGDRS